MLGVAGKNIVLLKAQPCVNNPRLSECLPRDAEYPCNIHVVLKFARELGIPMQRPYINNPILSECLPWAQWAPGPMGPGPSGPGLKLPGSLGFPRNVHVLIIPYGANACPGMKNIYATSMFFENCPGAWNTHVTSMY